MINTKGIQLDKDNLNKKKAVHVDSAMIRMAYFKGLMLNKLAIITRITIVTKFLITF